MLNQIQTELVKLKRKQFILFALLSSAAMPFINTVYTLNLPRNTTINRTFTDFYKFDFTEWMLLPCVLSVIGSMIFFTERENDTLKQLMIIPVNKAVFLFSKLIILFLFSILFMLLTAIFTVMGASVINYSDMTAALIYRLFKLCIETGIFTVCAMLPIVLIIVIAKKEYIIPICAALIYSISGAIFASHLMGIHPLASVAGIVWNKNIEGVKISPNLKGCIINLVLVSFIFIGASIYTLKKQEY
ncbi:MAG: ABC transporter permease [Spirochaetes bacterium]|nr:ABC transporter permease [Spirochaetota bacterium]